MRAKWDMGLGEERSRRPPGTADLLGYVFLAALILVACRSYLSPLLYPSGEASVYAAGADSLAAGRGYRFHGWHGEPRITGHPPAQALVLSVASVAGRNPIERLERMRWLGTAVAVLAGGAVFWFGRRQGVPLGVMMGLTAALMTSPPWLEAWLGLSPDLLAIALFHALAARALSREPDVIRWHGWLLVGVVGGAIYLSRTATLAWLPVLGIVAAIHARTIVPVIVVLVPAVAAVLAWSTWSGGGGFPGDMWAPLMDAVAAADGAGKGQSGWLPDLGLDSIRWLPGRLKAILQDVGWLKTVSAWVGGIGGLALMGIGIHHRIRGEGRSPTDWSRGITPGVEDGWARYQTQLQICIGAAWLGLVLTLPLASDPPAGWARASLLLIPAAASWAWIGVEVLLASRPRLRETVESLVMCVLMGWAGVNAWFQVKPPATDPDLEEAVRWVGNTRQLLGAVRFAAEFDVPQSPLQAAAKEPLLADYLVSSEAWEAMRRQESGYPRPEYVLIRAGSIGKHLEAGVGNVVLVTTRTNYAVLAVDPGREIEFRRAKGIPVAGKR